MRIYMKEVYRLENKDMKRVQIPTRALSLLANIIEVR